MPELDLTQTALIIKGRDGPTEDVLRLDANEGRLVVSQPDVSGSGSVYVHPESRECTPAVHFVDPEIHLRFDSEMKDPSRGWSFGLSVGKEEEEEVCDVFLGIEEEVQRSKKKISHTHFRIIYNFESGILVLANESRHGTTVLAPSIGDNGMKILVRKGRQSLNPSEVTVVKVADLEFLLSYPTLSGVQKLQHEANWKEFAQKYKDAVPGLGQLALSSSASTRPPSHRIGQRGGYTFFEELGRGNYGIVRRVTAYHSGAEYAAKEYFKTNAEQEARNLAEIAMLQSLSHPHIVKFVDLIADLAGLVLVMEYMPGNLKHHHREKRFSRTELKAILRQVLDAVAYLHGKGRVHRDIKPENILLRTRDPPFAKISDFGLATIDGFLRTECGTKKYAAPEIYKGVYDRSVDIWSIGATGFDVAKGLPDKPDGLSHEDWATEVQRRVTEAYKERADPFLGLLKEMLDIKPTARPSAEACLLDPRLDVSPRDDQFDLNQGRDVGKDLVTAIPGPPTKIMPTSLILKIVGINKNVDDSDNDEEAETQILYPAATSKPQTPADAQASKARERPPTNASYPPDDCFGVLINSNQEDPPHGQPRKRPRTGEINSAQLGEESAPPAASPITAEEFLWNGQQFRKCLVNNIPVRMRITDQWFCLLDLAKAGGKNSQWAAKKASSVDPSSKELCRDGNYQRVLVAPHIVLPYLNELGLQNNTALHQLISNGGTIGVLHFFCAQLGLDCGHFMKETARACTSDHQDSGNEINTLRTAAAMHPANKTGGEGGVNVGLTDSLHSAQLPTKHHPGFVLEPGTDDDPGTDHDPQRENIDDSDNDEEAETRIFVPAHLSDEHVETSTELASKATERSRLKASSNRRSKQYEPQHRLSISRRSLATGEDSLHMQPAKRPCVEKPDAVGSPTPTLAHQWSGSPTIGSDADTVLHLGHQQRTQQIEVMSNEYRPGYVRFAIGEKMVSMRKSDCWICATQILALTDMTTRQRKAILRRIKRHTTVETQKPNTWVRSFSSWISLAHGRYLCQFLGLVDAVRPLLQYGSKNIASEDKPVLDNYLVVPNASYTSYLLIPNGTNFIAIRKADFWINVNHIARAVGGDFHELDRIKRRNVGISFNVDRNDIPEYQGTYVDFETGCRLCDSYRLFELRKQLQIARNSLVAPEDLSEDGSSSCNTDSSPVADIDHGIDSTALQEEQLSPPRALWQGTGLKGRTEYFGIFLDGRRISIRPSEKLINASHLLIAGGIHRRDRQKWLSDHDITKKNKVQGHSAIQGMYIDYEDGLTVCKYLGLDKETILQGIRAHTGPRTMEDDGRNRDQIPNSLLHASPTNAGQLMSRLTHVSPRLSPANSLLVSVDAKAACSRPESPHSDNERIVLPSSAHNDHECAREFSQFIWNGELFRACTLQSNVIKLRVSDKWMSFESLAKAALKTDAWIAATLQKIDGISKETYQHDEDQGTLVSFNLALSFITEFGLGEHRQLQLLMENGTNLVQLVRIMKGWKSVSSLGYVCIFLDCWRISICPSAKLINASHLLKARRIHRAQLTRWLLECNIEKFYPVCDGFSGIRGSYVDYEEGLTLCERLGLDKGVILQGMRENTPGWDCRNKENVEMDQDKHRMSAAEEQTEVMDTQYQHQENTEPSYSGPPLTSDGSSFDRYSRSSFWKAFGASPGRLLEEIFPAQ